MINILKEYITACTVSSKRNYSRYFFCSGENPEQIRANKFTLNACTLVMTSFNKNMAFNLSSKKN